MRGKERAPPVKIKYMSTLYDYLIIYIVFSSRKNYRQLTNKYKTQQQEKNYT